MSKRLVAASYWILCALEGVGAVYWLWAAREAGSKASLSPARLATFLAPLLLAGLFGLLAILEMRVKMERSGPFLRLLERRQGLLSAFLLYAAGMLVTFTYAVSLMRIERLHAYFRRFQPLWVWAALIGLQFVLFALLLRGREYWKAAAREMVNRPTAQRVGRWLQSPAGGITLLLLSFLIGLTKLYYGRFVDEGDTITVGWLLSRGAVLHKDVFAHHFPFSYFWTAAVTSLFGNSFAAIRISVLLLQIGLFAAGMRATGAYLAIGLASVLWNLVNQFFRGQQAIFANFDALLMVAVFLLVFDLYIRKKAPGRLRLAVTGLLAGLALLTDPLMVYPVVVALAALAATGWLYPAKPGQARTGAALRNLLWAGASAALPLALFALYLWANGVFQAFYREAIWFNAEVYSRYVDANPNRLGMIAHNLVTGLDIFDGRWVQEINPFLPLETYRSVGLEGEHTFFSWVFSSFLLRLSILTCATGLILNHKPAAALFLYVFAAALMNRFDDGFYANGFYLVGMFAAFYTFTRLRHPAGLEQLATPGPVNAEAGLSQPVRAVSPLERISRAGWIPFLALLAVMYAWLGFRGGEYLLRNWREVSDDRHVSQYKKFGDEVRQLTCNRPDVELSVFPINPIVNFVTGIPPASRYVWMYPWVAEVGQQELIAELKANPAAVVWINVERKAGSDQGVATYMADTIAFLDREYSLVRGGLWMSPQAAAECSGAQVEIEGPQE